MQSLYKALLVAAVMLPSAAAAEFTPYVDEVDLANRASVALQLRYQHTLALASEKAPALQAHASPGPTRVLSDFAGFSDKGAAVRFLYSALADKRTFISYSSSKPGRPAELRVAVRISL